MIRQPIDPSDKFYNTASSISINVIKKIQRSILLIKFSILLILPIFNHLSAQNAGPVISSTGVQFEGKRIPLNAIKDRAILISDWQRVFIIRSKIPELLLTTYDFSGKKIGPDRSVFGRVFILERTERIVLAYTNNEINNQDTLLLNKNNKIISKINIKDPIVDWSHSEDGKLIWVFLPNDAGRYFFTCRIFDLNGIFVGEKVLKAGNEFKINYANTEYTVKVNVKTK